MRVETLRIGAPVVVLLLALSAPAAAQIPAEWQIRPFVGVTFGGDTNVIDWELASGSPNIALGVSAGWVGEIIGFEGDLALMPGFFQSGEESLVSKSRVTTLTGNITIGPPRSVTEFTLRPYFVGGFGLMRASTESLSGVNVDLTRPAVNLGGGVNGPLSDQTGLCWELRYFRSLGGEFETIGLEPQKLSFWRANMALVIRL